MKHTGRFPGIISSNEVPITDMDNSLFRVRKCMETNRELRPIIEGSLDYDYIDKYSRFSDNMNRILSGLEEFLTKFKSVGLHN